MPAFAFGWVNMARIRHLSPAPHPVGQLFSDMIADNVELFFSLVVSHPALPFFSNDSAMAVIIDSPFSSRDLFAGLWIRWRSCEVPFPAFSSIAESFFSVFRPVRDALTKTPFFCSHQQSEGVTDLSLKN